MRKHKCLTKLCFLFKSKTKALVAIKSTLFIAFGNKIEDFNFSATSKSTKERILMAKATTKSKKQIVCIKKK